MSAQVMTGYLLIFKLNNVGETSSKSHTVGTYDGKFICYKGSSLSIWAWIDNNPTSLVRSWFTVYAFEGTTMIELAVYYKYVLSRYYVVANRTVPLFPLFSQYWFKIILTHVFTLLICFSTIFEILVLYFHYTNVFKGTRTFKTFLIIFLKF
mgnify:CR=1 FL=1